MNQQRKSTEEVFSHHLEAYSKKDIVDVISDFSEDAIYISSTGIIAKGKAQIKKVYENYFESQDPKTTSAITNKVIEGGIVFLEWTSDSPVFSVQDGVDTFVINNGYILAQTAKFTVVKKIDII